MVTQLINGKIFTPTGWVENGSVIIKDHYIKDILNHSNRLTMVDRVIDAEGAYVLPGGIDMHVHGGGGRDFMETSADAFMTAVEAHRSHGTTSIFPTLSSSTTEMISDAAVTCEKLMEDPMNGILGLHLEGPYFNPKMAGGQMRENIRVADPQRIRAPRRGIPLHQALGLGARAAGFRRVRPLSPFKRHRRRSRPHSRTARRRRAGLPRRLLAGSLTTMTP